MKRCLRLFLILLFIPTCLTSQILLQDSIKEALNSRGIDIHTSFTQGKEIKKIQISAASGKNLLRQSFSPLDSCATQTYRLKIGNATSNDVINEIYSTDTYDLLLTGKTNCNNGQYDALLLKLDPNGRLIWMKTYGELNAEEEFFNARKTTDGGVIVIGSYTTVSPSAGWIFICKLDNNGNVQWTKRLKDPNTSTLYRGSDIIELTNGNLAFIGDDGQSIVYGILTGTGTLLWQKTVIVTSTVKSLRVIEDYNGLILGSTGTEAGWYVSNIFKVDAANGNILWNKQFGGSTQNSNYVFHKIEFINLRPRITGVLSENGSPYQFFRATVNTTGSVEFIDKFTTAVSPSPVNARSSTTPWSQALSFSTGNTNDLTLLKRSTENPLEWSYNFSTSSVLSLASMERTLDAGYIIACNVANDILLIKTDSAGLSPSCPGSGINFSENRIVPTIPTINISSVLSSVQENNTIITSTVPVLDTLYTCKQIYCPPKVIEDTCLSSFYKTYRSYDFCDLPLGIIESTDNKIIVSGHMRTGPYSPETEKSFVIKMDKKGDLISKKTFRIGRNNVASFQKKSIDGNILVSGYYFASNTLYGVYVLKLDNNLNIIWSKTYQIPVTQWQYYDFTETTSGDILIYLTYYNFSQLSDRLVLIKLDMNGNPLWQKSYKPVYNFSLVGNYGRVVSNGNDLFIHASQLETNNQWNTLVVKLDKNTGDVMWGKRYKYQNNRTEFIFGMDIFNNKLYLSGLLPTMQADAASYLKLDTSGNVIKFVTHTKPNNEFRHIFTLTQNGDLVSSYNNIDYSTNPSVIKDFYLRLDSNLNIKYSKRSPANNYNIVYKLTETQSGEIFAAGANFYTDPYNSDILIKKFNPDGILGACQTDTFDFNENYPVMTVVDQPVNKTDEPLIQITNLPVVSENYSLQQQFLYCSSVLDCDTIWLEGPQMICDTSQQIFRSRKNPGCNASTYWSVNSPNVLSFNSDSVYRVKFLQSGTYTLKGKIYTGCRWLEDSLIITVTIRPDTLNIGADTSLCPNNNKTLNAHSGFVSYRWQDGSTDSTFIVTSPGTYWVETQDACNNIYRDTIIISPAPPIPFDLGPDLSKCNTDSLTITAPAGFMNYAWSPSYNINTTTGQVATVFPSLDTIYRIIAEKTPGCFAFDSIRVNVNLSQPIYLGADTSFCSGTSIVLNAGSGFSNYLWSTGSNSQTVNVNTAGSYSVIATDINNCKSKDTLLIVNVFSNPVINFPADGPICLGASQVLNAGSGFSIYNWSTGATSNAITVDTPGSYWVNVRDNNGCAGSDTIIITSLLPVPSGFLKADTFICSYSSIQLVPTTDFKNYLWSSGNTGKSIVISQPGTYWLQVTDNNDCKGRDTIIVSPKQCLEGFYIPSAFTPNHNGINDDFKPFLFGKVLNYHFTIYNRWGQMVFDTRELGKGWNGKVGGLEQQTAVFVWQCSYQFENKDIEFRKGTVVLIH